jgi:hypothetical protein
MPLLLATAERNAGTSNAVLNAVCDHDMLSKRLVTDGVQAASARVATCHIAQKEEVVHLQKN